MTPARRTEVTQRYRLPCVVINTNLKLEISALKRRRGKSKETRNNQGVIKTFLKNQVFVLWNSSLHPKNQACVSWNSSLRFVESSLRFVNSSFYRKNQVFENACELHRTR